MTGSGTIGDPYIIENVDDLQAMEDHLDAYYELGGDIDALATSGWNGGLGFDPISYFEGHLDGKGFSISSLFINRPDDYVALFYYVYEGYGDVPGGTVQNLGLVDCSITGERAGSIAYINYGIITKSYATGAIVGARSSLLSPGNAAGFVILNYGTISDCYSRCSVLGDYAAGFSVYNDEGTEDNCYSAGEVTGCSSEYDEISPSSDFSNAGTWTIEPSDGVFYDKVLTNDGDTTYIMAQSNDCQVLFGFPINIPVEAIIRSLRVTVISRNVSSGTITMAAVLRVDGTDYASPNVNRTNITYGLTGFTLFQTNPATGSPWTVDDINGVGANPLQAFGVKVTDATPNIRFTQIYIAVSYFLPTDQTGFCWDNDGTISNSFWDMKTSGHTGSDGGTGKTTAEMKTKTTFTDAGWDFTTPIWYIHPTINDGYPAFIGVVTRIKGNPNIDQRMFQHVERMGR